MDFLKMFTTHAYRYDKYYLKVPLTLIQWNAFKFKNEDDVRTGRKVCVINSLFKVMLNNDFKSMRTTFLRDSAVQVICIRA